MISAVLAKPSSVASSAVMTPTGEALLKAV
jgi:hypothetical protein